MSNYSDFLPVKRLSPDSGLSGGSGYRHGDAGMSFHLLWEEHPNVTSGPQRTGRMVGWEDGSVGDVLAPPTRGPELGSQGYNL